MSEFSSKAMEGGEQSNPVGGALFDSALKGTLAARCGGISAPGQPVAQRSGIASSASEPQLAAQLLCHWGVTEGGAPAGKKPKLSAPSGLDAVAKNNSDGNNRAEHKAAIEAPEAGDGDCRAGNTVEPGSSWDLGGWGAFAASMLGGATSGALGEVGALTAVGAGGGGASLLGKGHSVHQGEAGAIPSQNKRSAKASEPGQPLMPQGGGGTAAPGDVVSGYVIYPGEVRHGGSLAWRNNNPGNIRPGNFTQSHGAFPGKSNHNFGIFPSYAQGFAAISALLRTPNYQSKTILKAMETYAPAADKNDPVAYSNSVHKMTGLETSLTVSSLSDGELGRMASAIQRVEGYIVGKIYHLDDPELPVEVRHAIEGSSKSRKDQAPTKDKKYGGNPGADASGPAPGNVGGHATSPATAHSGKPKESLPFAKTVTNNGALPNVNAGVKLTAAISAGYAVLAPYLPQSVRLTSGLRTDDDQRALINRMFKKNKGPAGIENALGQQQWLVGKGFKVAKVGASRHRTGLAFDLSGAPLEQIKAKVMECAAEHPDTFFLSRTILETKNNCLHVELAR